MGRLRVAGIGFRSRWCRGGLSSVLAFCVRRLRNSNVRLTGSGASGYQTAHSWLERWRMPSQLGGLTAASALSAARRAVGSLWVPCHRSLLYRASVGSGALR